MVAWSVIAAVDAVPAAAAPEGLSPGSVDVPKSVTTAAGRWLVDEFGRVVITHGINQVEKRAPYVPALPGFGADDAALLAANGVDSVRLGIIWAGVEPEPGRYDDDYIARVADTVRVLAEHGVMTILDMHQDMYSERFQGEGAPAWAVLDDTPAEPKLGFPANYVVMPALARAYDLFWENAPGPGGVGLQDRFAAAWAHVAEKFGGMHGLAAYELFNEPFPGTDLLQCVGPTLAGCPNQDGTKLAAMQSRVRDAIRAVDPSTLIMYEPFVPFDHGVDTSHPALSSASGTRDTNAAFSFHNYCGLATITGVYTGCDNMVTRVFDNADNHVRRTGNPALLTEFGATTDLTTIREVARIAADRMIGWLYWSYCTCNDPTGFPDEGLVSDPSKPLIGDNVDWARLAILAAPHPQRVAGTPIRYNADGSTFHMTYSTARADGRGRFDADATTVISVPALIYPRGYHASVTGGTVTSPPDSPTLTITATAPTVEVTVTGR